MRILTLVLFLWPVILPAQDIEVDVELFLAVDVSRSMNRDELELQRQGYSQALMDADVLAAIKDGPLGRIAVTYVEWAGDQAQRIVVPWQILATTQDAQNIAETIAARKSPAMRRTSISGALAYAMESFEHNGFTGLRRVIDVSGDGPNNQGPPVTQLRDAAVARGFVINGLPLMTVDLLSEFWGIPDLDIYYENCVIGGPGAFVVPVLSWNEFPAAIKRKLILEVSALPPYVRQAQFAVPSPYDCLVGEKMREANRTYFEIP
ncbi:MULTISPECIES: DUF1194 domain-containing protein [Roseobacter]|uniref:VWFA domain-containing protein n=1 Tax=Roseobacter litoralis (strain ATCC 49566 / DSM 6996 / JCM 21268 / NBRC 15278 / OCh 149) TaxID=391595 RepID=F7ZC41_ROSLO|nr:MULTISPECIES: DUF1194 domain-containing protein [Roseobacter]AEI94427.1 hypothetical protein DUF1194 [Roseobacter litoralis Och 149]GIT87132.1 hypothetical protein ROBYS_21480 [Roseobacter sp. OBYS 0001]